VLQVSTSTFAVDTNGVTHSTTLTNSGALQGGTLFAQAGTGSGVSKVGGAIFDYIADVQTTHTDGTEDDLFSDSIPSSTLAFNAGKLRACYGLTVVSSATANRQIRVYFAGTAIFDSGSLVFASSGYVNIQVLIIRVSASVVRYSISATATGTTVSSVVKVGELTGLTLSAANTLKITGKASSTGAASGDIVAKLGTVEFLP
jgi:hypothetical protein